MRSSPPVAGPIRVGVSEAHPPRPEPRIAKRIPCQIARGASAYPGMVLNVSRGGLFVQTSLAARPGEALWIDLDGVSSEVGIALEARVVWQRVARDQPGAQRPGFGARILRASQEYFRLIVTSDAERAAAARHDGDG